MAWLIPSLGYVVVVGLLGVTVKLALEGFTWQELVVWTSLAYVACSAVLLLSGTPVRLRGGLEGSMLVASALIPPAGLAMLFFALTRGDASRVIPITAVYPALTALLAVLLLAEPISWRAAAGIACVVLGVILLSL